MCRDPGLLNEVVGAGGVAHETSNERPYPLQVRENVIWLVGGAFE